MSINIAITDTTVTVQELVTTITVQLAIPAQLDDKLSKTPEIQNVEVLSSPLGSPDATTIYFITS